MAPAAVVTVLPHHRDGKAERGMALLPPVGTVARGVEHSHGHSVPDAAREGGPTARRVGTPLCYTGEVSAASTDETAVEPLVVDVRGLVKGFGSAPVLRGLDLSVRRGEVHAFLGPNGAGKTTTLRILLGLLRPEGGSVRVLGMDPWADAPALHRRLAYVPGDVSLWPNLTGGEVIDLLGRLHGQVSPKRRDDLVERFDLDPTKKARAYSKGNRQKVALVAALATDAELYLFDEPTSGLDPLMEATFRECVCELQQRGGSVLLSSHILSEAEALSDRVSIIRDGTVVDTGTLDQLRHLTRTTISAELASAPDGLSSISGVHDLVVDGRRVGAQVDADAMAPLLVALASCGVTSLVSHPPTLEELFLRHYAEDSA